ncbi:MAG: ABC transporter ATP-binding protein [Promethearchaeota archaeon]
MTQQRYKSGTRYQLSALSRYKGLTLLAGGLALFAALLTVLPSWFLGDATDALQYAIDNGLGLTPTFVYYCLLILGVAGALFVTILAVGYAFAIMTLRWERDARQEFFEIIQENSMTFHDQVDSKQLLAIAMQDVRWVRFSLNPALRSMIMSLGSLIITSIFLAIIDWMLGLLMLFGAPLYLFFAYRYAKKVEPVRRARSEQNEVITAISQEVFRGIEVVRAFGTEEYEENKFEEASKEYQRLQTREARLASFYIPHLIMTAITFISLIYVAYYVLLGIYHVSTLVRVLGLLTSFDAFSFMLPRFLLVLRGANINAQRIVKLLSWEDPLQEPEHSADVDWSQDIVFKEVSFRYTSNDGENDSYALRKLNFTIPGGTRVALIGGPGGGKSTILKLLLRLYDPTQGKILIGGVDLRGVHTRDVRAAVGLVEQDIFLFRRSVKDNIAFGGVGACEEEIIEAAQKAQAHEFIEKLPQGYETIVGERGMTLSGGQRQRLAIARTLLQNPRILLLDDSVSAIDAQTEFFLRKALDEVMRGRTSITVTQRLRTLLESDLIIIVDKGRLVAIGTHQELLESSDHYQRIFERLPGALQHVKQSTRSGGAR